MFLQLHRASDEMEIVIAISAIVSVFIDTEDDNNHTCVETVTAGVHVKEDYRTVLLKLKAANRDGGETFV